MITLENRRPEGSPEDQIHSLTTTHGGSPEHHGNGAEKMELENFYQPPHAGHDEQVIDRVPRNARSFLT